VHTHKTVPAKSDYPSGWLNTPDIDTLPALPPKTSSETLRLPWLTRLSSSFRRVSEAVD